MNDEIKDDSLKEYFKKTFDDKTLLKYNENYINKKDDNNNLNNNQDNGEKNIHEYTMDDLEEIFEKKQNGDKTELDKMKDAIFQELTEQIKIYNYNRMENFNKAEGLVSGSVFQKINEGKFKFLFRRFNKTDLLRPGVRNGCDYEFFFTKDDLFNENSLIYNFFKYGRSNFIKAYKNGGTNWMKQGFFSLSNEEEEEEQGKYKVSISQNKGDLCGEVLQYSELGQKVLYQSDFESFFDHLKLRLSAIGYEKFLAINEAIKVEDIKHKKFYIDNYLDVSKPEENRNDLEVLGEDIVCRILRFYGKYNCKYKYETDPTLNIGFRENKNKCNVQYYQNIGKFNRTDNRFSSKTEYGEDDEFGKKITIIDCEKNSNNDIKQAFKETINRDRDVSLDEAAKDIQNYYCFNFKRTDNEKDYYMFVEKQSIDLIYNQLWDANIPYIDFLLGNSECLYDKYDQDKNACVICFTRHPAHPRLPELLTIDYNFQQLFFDDYKSKYNPKTGENEWEHKKQQLPINVYYLNGAFICAANEINNNKRDDKIEFTTTGIGAEEQFEELKINRVLLQNNPNIDQIQNETMRKNVGKFIKDDKNIVYTTGEVKTIVNVNLVNIHDEIEKEP